MEDPNVKTLFLFRKKKTCAKRKNSFFGKAFFFKERFIGNIGFWDLSGSIGIYLVLGFSENFTNTKLARRPNPYSHNSHRHRFDRR
ncbi:MAG TPA: hypothetical protein VMW40_06065 [Candidatus Bathyarchaeia archaeon]|nr:hypothetical protein [Candidatus Bathyarchaeia archaeon]